jgi:small subunit ribosomal protein S17
VEKKLEDKKNKKIVTGQVVSNKMNKTIVISITRKKLHKQYKKYITVTKKIKVHDEKNECSIGDIVKAVETRPLSKDKNWRLVEVLEKVK